MTDTRTALLQSIMSHREDDTPRLIYADWRNGIPWPDAPYLMPCPQCKGQPQNLWHCPTWPGLDFVLPEATNYRDTALREMEGAMGVPPRLLR